MSTISPVEKNQTLLGTVTDLTYEGLGVVKIDHFPIFIANALPGEEIEYQIVKVGKKIAFGRVVKRIKESPHRQKVPADLLKTGAAPLAHLDYAEQLKFKEHQVKNAVERIAKLPEVPVLPILGAEQVFHYRNKAQVPVRNIDTVLATGFFRQRSHDLIPLEDFYIQNEAIDRAIIVVRDLLRKFKIRAYDENYHTGQLRHIIVRRGYYSHEMMIVLVTRKAKFFEGEKLAQAIHEALPGVVSIIQNVNSEKTNVILGDTNKTLWGKDAITDTLLGKTYRISPSSFYQVNTPQAEKLYQTAIDFAELTPEDVAIDAYCGIGTIGLSFADKIKALYGVEVVPQAVEDARYNAAKNGIQNAHFVCSSAEKALEKWQTDGIEPDVIFVDPPRKGLTPAFINSAAETNARRIIYISCNPATLARDLALFAEKGYHTQKIQPVDMFPQTLHTEAVALLVK
ncbi:23S rRNA (uracil(1939)-C(5))-methyltransferase RlmD [Enterococcus hirae]|nr:23S rRNA (uracil(1939)-C(5))-methyltransferase RlmD [Enterococcus hirae]